MVVTPSCTGIRRSTSSTSGRSASTSARASVPIGGVAHHLEVGLGGEQAGDPGANHRVIVGEHDADPAHRPASWRL